MFFSVSHMSARPRTITMQLLTSNACTIYPVFIYVANPYIRAKPFRIGFALIQPMAGNDVYFRDLHLRMPVDQPESSASIRREVI